MYIACSTITWGQFRNQPDSPYAGPEGQARILDEVREAGYSHVVTGVSAGRRGGALPAPEAQLRSLAQHRLRPAPGYYSGQPLYEPANRTGEVEGARRAAAYTRALGMDALFVGPVMFPHRRETAGPYPQGPPPHLFNGGQ